MLDNQRIPNSDVNSPPNDSDIGNRSGNEDVERPNEIVPLPPDEDAPARVEEPPEENEKAPVGEDTDSRKRLV